MMKTIMRLMLVSLLVVVAAPSYSGEAWQSFTCQVLDETTEDQVLEAAAKWLKAARSMKGGENLKVAVAFPVAAQMGETDFRMLLTAPSIQEWGTFWDGYGGSPAAKVDDEYKDMLDCPDSRLFEVVEIK